MRSVKHSEAAKRNQVKAVAASKQRAIEDYYLSPNVCKQCGKTMLLKEGQQPCIVRLKKFCSRSCSAINANKSPKRPVSNNRRPCPFCGTEIRNKRTESCIKCRSARLHQQTGLQPKKEVSQTRISAHARRVLKDSLSSCVFCGYDFVVEAAHIRAVKSFGQEELVKDINAMSNLIPLCPNHHLEFDRGKLSLEQILSACNSKGQSTRLLSGELEVSKSSQADQFSVAC